MGKLKQILCGHNFGPEFHSTKKEDKAKGNKRFPKFYYECLKCGKRKYID